MKIFGRNSESLQSGEKSDKLDIKDYVRDDDLEILREKGKQARETREGINSLLLQSTSSTIAIMAAVALFILPVSDNVKSHAKDVLIFLFGGASGYAVKQANKKSDKDSE